MTKNKFLPIQLCKIVLNANADDFNVFILSGSLINKLSSLYNNKIKNIQIENCLSFFFSYAAGVIPRRSPVFTDPFSHNEKIATNC